MGQIGGVLGPAMMGFSTVAAKGIMGDRLREYLVKQRKSMTDLERTLRAISPDKSEYPTDPGSWGMR